jgi:hypothetical protein
MSKNNNVNPGQYKVAGRERPGQDIAAKRHKVAESVKAHELKQQRGRQSKNRKSGSTDK